MRMIKFALCAALIASMPMGTAFAEDYVRILQYYKKTRLGE